MNVKIIVPVSVIDDVKFSLEQARSVSTRHGCILKEPVADVKYDNVKYFDDGENISFSYDLNVTHPLDVLERVFNDDKSKNEFIDEFDKELFDDLSSSCLDFYLSRVNVLLNELPIGVINSVIKDSLSYDARTPNNDSLKWQSDNYFFYDRKRVIKDCMIHCISAYPK